MSLRYVLFSGLVILSHSLFSYDSLTFRSSFEARLLKAAMTSKDIDLLSLYASASVDSVESAKYSVRLDDFFAKVDQKVRSAKTDKLRAKLLFKEAHEFFLKKYEEKITLDRIFKDGYYNCVTGSMLYAIIFEHFDIPYDIKETPTHVYLVAFPGTENIMIETTSPNGFLVVNETYKQQYVDELVKLKYTTREYVNSVGMEKAFNEFYYNNDKITTKNLAALQYYNQALEARKDEASRDAVNNISKAILLYPSTKHAYFKQAFLAELINNSRFDNLQDVYFMCEFSNTSNDLRNKELIESQFASIIEQTIWKKDDKTFLEESYSVVTKHLKDQKVLNEITFLYNENLTRWYAFKKNFDKAMDHGSEAYEANPKDVRLQEVLTKIVYYKLQGEGGDLQSPKAIIDFIEKYPVIMKNPKFQALVLMMYCALAEEAFQDNDGEAGYKILTDVEAKIKTGGIDESVIEKRLLVTPWAEASGYHFRRKEFAKAKQIINKGLAIFPGNEELKERMRIVVSEEEYRKRQK